MPAKIEGMEKLLAELDGFSENIPRALSKAGKFAMAEAIEKPAKKMAPVDTGRLRASIATQTTEQTPQETIVETGTNVFYAPYIEFGTGIYAVGGDGRKTPWAYTYAGKKGPQGLRFTHGNKPQPFLETAMQLNQNRIEGLVSESLQKQIELVKNKISQIGGV
jgi:HK97 gp10 family phage protein